MKACLAKHINHIRIVVELIDVPNVAGIEEQSTMQVAEQAVAQFKVAHQADVASLEEIGI